MLGKLRPEGWWWWLWFFIVQDQLLPATLAQRAWAVFGDLKAGFEVGGCPT